MRLHHGAPSCAQTVDAMVRRQSRRSRRVDLESEEVWALDLLVHFCYTGIYDWRAAHYGRTGAGYVDCFVAHAVVYDLAVKLGIPELRDSAFEEFELDTEACRTAAKCR